MKNNKSTMSFSPTNPDTWPLLLTIEQTAEILRVSPWTLRKWDEEKRLVAIRFGSRKDRKYRKEDVLKAVNQGL